MPLRCLVLIVLLAGIGVAAPASSAASPDDDAALGAKLDPYIECMNRHSEMAFKSRDRYLSWVKSAKEGPTGRESVVYGLYPLYDPADCFKAIEAAAAKSPDVPALEAAASRYAGALGALKRVVDEAHDYYDLEDYRDDGFAKGRQMHAGLMQAWAAFETASDALDREVATLKQGLVERGVVRLATAHQVHGADVVRHATQWRGWLRERGVDGHITDVPGTALAVTIADCTPVFISHPRGVIAALHAGWQIGRAHV